MLDRCRKGNIACVMDFPPPPLQPLYDTEHPNQNTELERCLSTVPEPTAGSIRTYGMKRSSLGICRSSSLPFSYRTCMYHARTRTLPEGLKRERREISTGVSRKIILFLLFFLLSLDTPTEGPEEE